MLLTVAEDGRIVVASVASSSGYPRLDEAATAHAMRSWRLVPGTVNGKPAQMQVKMRLRFKLTN